MENLKNYWRKELGEQFRKQALEYIAGYIGAIGDTSMSDDGKEYTSKFVISDRMSTIFPLGMSCNTTTNEVCFVDTVAVFGKVKKDRYGLDKKIVADTQLIDPQGNQIDTKSICIDSLLFLLDYFDTIQSSDEWKK